MNQQQTAITTRNSHLVWLALAATALALLALLIPSQVE